MAHPIKTLFKDATQKASGGSSDLEGASLIKGDFEVNGQKVVIGMDLHEEVSNPQG
jgi:hypothetical protein